MEKKDAMTGSDLTNRARRMAEAKGKKDFYEFQIYKDEKGKFWLVATLFNGGDVREAL